MSDDVSLSDRVSGLRFNLICLRKYFEKLGDQEKADAAQMAYDLIWDLDEE